jgi:hypothetical protein
MLAEPRLEQDDMDTHLVHLVSAPNSALILVVAHYTVK